MGYRIGVDIGGTFTDCVVADERGGRTVAKAATTPGSLQDGVLEAVRRRCIGGAHFDRITTCRSPRRNGTGTS